MKRKNAFPGLIIFAAAAVVCTGCAFMSAVSIRTNDNLSSVRAGGTLRLSSSGRDIIWAVSSTSDGIGPVTEGTYITSNGMLMVAANERLPFLYVTATSARDGKSDIKLIRVVTVTGVIVSPANQPVAIGRSFNFGASVEGTNDPDNAVTWRVSSTPDGYGSVTSGTSVSSGGKLTIAIDETYSQLHLIAVSIVDPSKSGSVVVEVVVPTVTNVVVSPVSRSVRAGSSLQFAAAVTGTYEPDSTVTWKVSANAAGTGAVTPGTAINAKGLLSVAVNETLPILYVIANSAVDPSKSGSVLVNIIIPTVTSVTVNSSSKTVRAGETLQFSSAVTGTNEPDNTVTWKVSSNAAGTGSVTPGTGISAKGLLTVAKNETVSTLYVTATSAVDPTKSGTAIIGLIIPLVTGVAVSPSGSTMTTGSNLQFYANVAGVNNPDISVTWKVSSNAAGSGAVTAGTSINANGLLTLASNETAKTLYVFATSVFDPSKLGSVIVSVIIVTPTVANVTVSPGGQTIAAGGQRQFSATVTGTNNPDTSVAWKVSSNAAGSGAVTAGTSINANGLLTVASNETLTTLYIFATSVLDSSKSGSASIAVSSAASTPGQTATPAPGTTAPVITGVAVSPSTISIKTNNSIQFSATVAGTNNPGNSVIWKVSSNAAGNGTVANSTSINNTGKLTIAPNEWNPVLYVFATSAVDSTKTGLAIVTITNNNANQGSNQGN